MEKRFESWFHDQQIDWQSRNPNSSNPPFFLGHQNITYFGNNPKPESLKKVNNPSHVDEYIGESNLDDLTQEDTEELNALLYSDDDEEEVSTGHSPTLTGQQELRDEIAEEDVASSVGPTKRRKLGSGAHDVLCSGKPFINGSNDDESNEEVLSSFSSIGYEGSRNEKVREIISIFQDLVPGGKNGKDAMMVIDEAIHYLVSLKVKAKSLGLDTL